MVNKYLLIIFLNIFLKFLAIGDYFSNWSNMFTRVLLEGAE